MILVLGIGNPLLTDEGIGLHTLNYLQTEYPDLPNVRYLDGGTLSFTLAPELEAVDSVIVLDASELNAPSGTVKCFIGAAMDAQLQQPRRSVHEVGLTDLLSIVRLNGRMPTHYALIGIQPDVVDWGERPTTQVAAAIPTAAAWAIQLIEQWQTA